MNQLAITPDKRCLVSAGMYIMIIVYYFHYYLLLAYQQIRMYDIKSSDQTPVSSIMSNENNVSSHSSSSSGLCI